MIKWWKRLRRIVKGYDGDIEQLCGTIDKQHSELVRCKDDMRRLEAHIKTMTTIDADIAHGSNYPSTIFVSGRWRNNDYVQLFQIRDEDFNYIINILRDMRRHGTARHMDMPIEFRGTLLRDLDSH